MQSNCTLPDFPAELLAVGIKHIPGRRGYAADSLGRVWSCRGRGLKPTPGQWTQRKATLDRYGYEQITMCIDGKVGCVKIHRLILEAFVGPRPDGMECCHANGDRRDNRPCNLRWDTRASNMEDRDRHGSVKGCRNGRAKLTPADAAAIRLRYVRRCRINGQTAIAADYGIDQTTVSDIIRGHLWPSCRPDVLAATSQATA